MSAVCHRFAAHALFYLLLLRDFVYSMYVRDTSWAFVLELFGGKGRKCGKKILQSRVHVFYLLVRPTDNKAHIGLAPPRWNIGCC